MALLHRIQWIDERIRASRFPNINQIVEQFEISRRQALRDIEYLRDSLGAPLDYCAKSKGYYYTDRSFAVPSQFMTDNQKELLSALASHYEALSLNDRCQPFASDTFGKLAALLTRLSGQSAVELHKNDILRDGVVPFHAILQMESARLPRRAVPVPASLQPFYRGKNEQQYDIFEFYDSYEFIPALLASGLSCKVIHPKWLKHKLLQHLEQMREINLG
ncbi:hypothetical protein EBB07_27340 [Paenibacillaceae bacterium]|nr:hypothetical protein EBB07_27340 [Paenibacillaceae bacterium]